MNTIKHLVTLAAAAAAVAACTASVRVMPGADDVHRVVARDIETSCDRVNNVAGVSGKGALGDAYFTKFANIPRTSVCDGKKKLVVQ